MLTLQILDSDRDAFYRPLQGAGLTLGTDADADIQLRSQGVAPEHARIEALEPTAASDVPPNEAFKIVDLGTPAGTLVNGKLVAQCRVRLGDRIELGGAVLVVGRRVVRRATAADVLEPVVATPSRRTPRSGAPRSRSAQRRGPWLPIGIGVAVLATIGILAFTSSRAALPIRWGELAELRTQARFDEARSLVDQFAREWAGGDETRRARLDQVSADLDAADAALAAGRERVRRDAETRSRIDQIRELRAERDRGGDAGWVASRLLSELSAIRGSVTTRTAVQPPGDSADPVAAAESPGADRSVAAGHDSGQESIDGSAAADPEQVEFVRSQVAAIEVLRERGELEQAREQVAQLLLQVSTDRAAELQTLRLQVDAEIARHIEGVIAAARQRVASERIEDIDAALAELDGEAEQFPVGAAADRLRSERVDLLALRERRIVAAAAPDPASDSRSSTRTSVVGVDVRDRLAAARAADSAGRFEEAAAIFAELRDAVRAEDPEYAGYLEGRRVDVALLGGLASWALAEQSNVDPMWPRVDGRVDWSALDPVEVATGLRGRPTTPVALGGAAILAYRGGAGDVAETFLAKALRADRSQRELINGVIARGRGETPDSLGYRLVDNQFVREREWIAQKRSKELRRSVVRAFRLDLDQRPAWVEEILAAGPAELDALILAMQAEAAALAEGFADASFRRDYDRIAERRVELDAARAHALELIFDEETYFYPYRPPAVSPAKASTYRLVQADVDERVAELAEIWNDPKAAAKATPKRLRERYANFNWLVSQLEEFGVDAGSLRDETVWLETLPANTELTLKQFCFTPAERAVRDGYLKISAFNERCHEDLTRAEIAQVEITNDYRAMFGHRPMAISRKIVEAARGHAQEMAKLGYFSHFSPTPGRRSPSDRMKAAGYSRGISENIATHGSAASAHFGWIHSSGHHRNLLNPAHKEFAVGNSGKYWVQNFGRDDDYLSDPDFR